MTDRISTLIDTFSRVCIHIADHAPSLLIPNLDSDQEMITPLFKDADIENIDDWWGFDENLVKYLGEIISVENDVAGSMQENINGGLQELAQHPHLIEELRDIHDRAANPTGEVIKYIPHVAQYADCLTQTAGYKQLDALTEKIGECVVWPVVTLKSAPRNLKGAFNLNVAIVSTDGTPLKPKLQKLAL